MPRAEAGTPKAVANQIKSKGLTKLAHYCQPCNKFNRDANAMKMHCASESHVRNLLLMGENSKQYINDYSTQFKSDFLQLLRTSHGTKPIHFNRFYNELISNKNHIHLSATKWHSITEFCKYLGREGLCRVEDGEKGLEIAWIDNSPETLRKQDAIRKRDRMEKGDEEREQRQIQEQIDRAREAAALENENEEDSKATELHRDENTKIQLNFGTKGSATNVPEVEANVPSDANKAEQPLAVPLSIKPKNIFAVAAPPKKANVFSQHKERPMSAAERIMKEELERKRKRENFSFKDGSKRQRM